MSPHRPRIATEKYISPVEFDRLLRRAEKFQKLHVLQSVPKLSRVRKRPISAA